MVNDPLADLLTRIRNANLGHLAQVAVPRSKLKEAVVKVMKDKGFIEHFQVKNNDLVVVLKYVQGKARIWGLRRVSKPSRRVYRTVDKLRPVRSGYGMAILSTPQGVMGDEEARQRNLGGEVLAEVW